MKVPPQRLKKKEENDKFKTFLAKLSNLSINIPLIEAIQEIPWYAMLMIKLMSKKYIFYDETIEITHGYSAIMTSAIVEKKEDPWAFTIPCIIGIQSLKKLCVTLELALISCPKQSIEYLVWEPLQQQQWGFSCWTDISRGRWHLIRCVSKGGPLNRISRLYGAWLWNLPRGTYNSWLTFPRNWKRYCGYLAKKNEILGL